MAFLVFAHYTSWLYAELTIVKIVHPIDGFQAMLDDGSYKLGLMRGWAVHTEIEVGTMYNVLKWVIILYLVVLTHYRAYTAKQCTLSIPQKSEDETLQRVWTELVGETGLIRTLEEAIDRVSLLNIFLSICVKIKNMKQDIKIFLILLTFVTFHI